MQASSVTSSYILSHHHTYCHIIIHTVTSSYMQQQLGSRMQDGSVRGVVSQVTIRCQCHIIIHSVASTYIVSHHHTCNHQASVHFSGGFGTEPDQPRSGGGGDAGPGAKPSSAPGRRRSSDGEGVDAGKGEGNGEAHAGPLFRSHGGTGSAFNVVPRQGRFRKVLAPEIRCVCVCV
jgi:hypothetical protein